MAEPACYYCTRTSTHQCPACGRLYCQEHGEDVCLRCLAPEAAMPSALVYRGALLALAVGALLTIFLLVDPPETKSDQDIPRTITSAPAAVTTNPARSATATTPTRTSSAGSRTQAPTATPGTAQGTTYTIESGDTLSDIADRFGITIDALLAANPGMTIDSKIVPGDIINIPKKP